ncbi:hypothetical protein TPHA_0K01020 [Tetrapisispora phaffii CBS 4417]|uniref:Glutathione hydrolase n=1 Tax=Tetrapisispora phaffii (strain ATCC 24235 / CBS 4417 / NBRC 1672 / NRRL Y-8282 / UCD 70-5) TaxID=1071381 RepID=G8BZA8_TETPH|nr:hypothetical protein TPHA_0K01020 [Tetrapisispora phaffii CBS 4417]CCE65236.1 hypothetical protein TPHA_0K01020 [Tetrapisispora phaffii CBS 4417]
MIITNIVISSLVCSKLISGLPVEYGPQTSFGKDKSQAAKMDSIFQIRGDSDHNIDLGDLDRSPSMTPDPSLLKIGGKGAISSDLQICSDLVLTHVLQKFPEANAADAAVTQALCIGMVNFFNSGVGGGGYVVYADGSNQDNHYYSDFREKAPKAAHKDMFKDCEMCSKVGGLASGVPGELAGLYDLYENRGSGAVSWYDLIKPVADLGYAGWEIGEVLYYALKLYEPAFMNMQDDWSFVLNKSRTGVKQCGDRISRPVFADTLMELARNGSAGPFYDPESWITQSMVSTLSKYGGILTAQDFKEYNVNSSKPLVKELRSKLLFTENSKLTVLTSSGSSSGAALLSALSIMEHFPDEVGGDYGEKTTFELIETMKWMASARSRLGDYEAKEIDSNSFFNLPQRVQEILDESWINKAVNSIQSNSVDGNFKTLPNWTLYDPEYEMNEPHGTAHFSIVDHHNNSVSLTTTVNLLFGSLVHDPKTGIIFNNEMDDFSQSHRSNAFNLSASIHNFPEPYKRPLSSTAPTIILDSTGHPDLIVGASGGSRIVTSIFQTIIRNYWYKMPLLESISYPRIHHQLLPNQAELESYDLVGSETTELLRNMGHSVIQEMPKSVVNAIKFVDGKWHAVSDFWRKRGVATIY